MGRIRPAVVTVRGVIAQMTLVDGEDESLGIGGVKIYSDGEALTWSLPNGEFSLSDLVESSDRLTVFFETAEYKFDPLVLYIHPCVTSQEVNVIVHPS